MTSNKCTTFLSEKENDVLQWEFKLNSALAKCRHLALHMSYVKRLMAMKNFTKCRGKCHFDLDIYKR
jgi:hypothetical protein